MSYERRDLLARSGEQKHYTPVSKQEAMMTPEKLSTALQQHFQVESSPKIKWAVMSHLGDRHTLFTPEGARQSALLTIQEDGAFTRRASLSFEFISHHYFSEANIGHLTIGIGSVTDPETGAPSLQGKGIVIGNVSAYGCRGECTETDYTNTVAIESYWANGNCVYGQTTQYPCELEDNLNYRVEIQVFPGDALIRYALWCRKPFGKWKKLYMSEINDQHFEQSTNRAGWWIGEVFSQHDWVVNFRNIKWKFD